MHGDLLELPPPPAARAGQSISRILQSLNVAHTWRYHKQHHSSEYVWRGWFQRPVIQDDARLLVVPRYIQAQPRQTPPARGSAVPRPYRCGLASVADCKLATAENMAYIHQHGGRFLSVLPRTRSEDAAFHARVLTGHVSWQHIYDKHDDQGDLVDQFSICEPLTQSAEGFRLIW